MLDLGERVAVVDLEDQRDLAGEVRRPDPAHPQAQQQRHAGQGRSALLRRSPARSKDALRLGCVGDRLHDLSRAPAQRNQMYQDLRELTARGQGARAWPSSSGPTRAAPASPRRARRRSTSSPTPRRSPRSSARTSSRSSRRARTSSRPRRKKVYEKYQIPIETLAERVRHVVQAAFNGKRIVIFSGGEAKGTDAVLDEVKEHRRRRLASARSWAATPSSVRAPRPSSSSAT